MFRVGLILPRVKRRKVIKPIKRVGESGVMKTVVSSSVEELEREIVRLKMRLNEAVGLYGLRHEEVHRIMQKLDPLIARLMAHQSRTRQN